MTPELSHIYGRVNDHVMIECEDPSWSDPANNLVINEGNYKTQLDTKRPPHFS